MTILPPRVSEALRALYEELAAEIARESPSCRLSGRCCRFREYDHTLFLSAVEASYLLEHAPEASRPLDEGETCPWQDDQGRCTAREARPLGCRIYFCDPQFQEAMPELSERYLSRLKVLAREAVLDWDYAPLHVHLRREPRRSLEAAAENSGVARGLGAE